MKTLQEKTINDYYQSLSEQEKEKIINEACKTERELWAKGFSLGMIEIVGQMIKERARLEIEGKKA